MELCKDVNVVFLIDFSKEANQGVYVMEPQIFNIPKDLLEIVDIFTIHNKELFLVGGSVRDILLNLKPKDFDVATNATPDEVIELLEQCKKYTILGIGKSFGVIKVITPEKNEYEIATFRSDVGSGRRPESVVYTTIYEDVKRRDFTINALFYDFHKKEVIDHIGGLEDIRNKVVKTVGNPKERFEEDRLRILRAVRFAARFGSLDEETYKAIKDNNSLVGVSEERIREEFLKGIQSSKNVFDFFNLLEDLNLLEQIFPDLILNKNFLNTKNIPILLSFLLKDNELKNLKTKLNDLKYSSIEITQVVFLHSFQSLCEKNAFGLKKLFMNSHLENVDLIDFVLNSGKPSTQLLNAFMAYSPTTNGDELLKLGFAGKSLGEEMLRIETEKFKCLIH